MVALKLWLDTRFRFLIGLIVMILLALLIVYLQYKVTGAQNTLAHAQISAETKAQVLNIFGDYGKYVDTTWYESNGGTAIAILAIILALGGPLAERNSVHLTLSLPVRRSSWLVAQAVLTMGLSVVMLLVSTAVLLAVGALMGHAYPPGQAALNALLCAVPTMAWIGLTLALGSYVLDKAKTALIVIPAKFLSPFLFTLPALKHWDMARLGRPLSMYPIIAWQQPLLLLFVCAVGGVAMAAHRYGQLDY
jgi:hypothetical protein